MSRKLNHHGIMLPYPHRLQEQTHNYGTTVNLVLDEVRTPSPPVTCLMPVLNGMPHLLELLASIAAQTYANFQLIVWDNGSTDGTVEALNEWIPSRISGSVHVGEPLSLGASRARLLELAETELCAIVDADDIHHPERLERQVARFMADPNLVAVGCVPSLIDEHGNPLPDWYIPTDDAEIRWRMRWQSGFNTPSVLFRRSVALKAGNFRNLRVAEDTDMWARMTPFGRMANLPGKLIRYRRHTAQTSAGRIDYSTVDWEIAKLIADAMFPELNGRAIAFWDAAYPRDADHRVTFTDLIDLHRMARLAARKANEPANYFMRSPYFRLQRRQLLMCLLVKAPFLGKALRVVRSRIKALRR